MGPGNDSFEKFPSVKKINCIEVLSWWEHVHSFALDEFNMKLSLFSKYCLDIAKLLPDYFQDSCKILSIYCQGVAKI